jgi:hypothetical protein
MSYFLSNTVLFKEFGRPMTFHKFLIFVTFKWIWLVLKSLLHRFFPWPVAHFRCNFIVAASSVINTMNGLLLTSTRYSPSLHRTCIINSIRPPYWKPSHPFINYPLVHTVIAVMNCHPSVYLISYDITDIGSQIVILWCILPTEQPC